MAPRGSTTHGGCGDVLAALVVGALLVFLALLLLATLL